MSGGVEMLILSLYVVYELKQEPNNNLHYLQMMKRYII